MSPLFSTIGNGTVQIWEAAMLMEAAAVRVPPPCKKRRAAQLDSQRLRISASNRVDTLDVTCRCRA